MTHLERPASAHSCWRHLVVAGILLLLISPSLASSGCAPAIDDDVLRGLPPAVLAPVNAARREVLSEERALRKALADRDERQMAAERAEVELERASASGRGIQLAQAECDLSRHRAVQAEQQVEVAERRLDLARSRFERAKARVVEGQNLAPADGLSQARFAEAVQDAQSELGEASQALQALRRQEDRLQERLRAARVQAFRR